ncbi:MAG: hypothetical protein ACOYMB_05125 [Patescibacteria group bacterium]
MKRKIMFLIVLIGMISSVSVMGQKLNGVIENGISNAGSVDEMNFRKLRIEVLPIRIGDGSNFFGIYAETNQVRAKNETQKWVSALNTWNIGVGFNSKLGAGEDDGGWFLETRLGFGQITTRSNVAAYGYKDKQVDFDLNAALRLGIFDPDASFFSRHMLNVNFQQPLSKTKELYFTDRIVNIGDSMTWNNQLFQGNFTETVGNFFVGDEWLMNFDVMGGFGLEHRMVGQLDQTMKYFSVGAGVSFFKLPYFQQNIVEIMPEFQLMDNSRFILKFKINLVPIIFLIWDKKTFDIKLFSANEKMIDGSEIHNYSLKEEGRV